MNKLEWYANYLKGQIVASFFEWPEYDTKCAICMVKYFDDNFGEANTKRFTVSYICKLNIQQIQNINAFLKIFPHAFENIYVTVDKLFVKNIKDLELVRIDKSKYIQLLAIEHDSIYRISASLYEISNAFSDDFYENISEIEMDKYAWGYCHGQSSE